MGKLLEKNWLNAISFSLVFFQGSQSLLSKQTHHRCVGETNLSRFPAEIFVFVVWVISDWTSSAQLHSSHQLHAAGKGCFFSSALPEYAIEVSLT